MNETVNGEFIEPKKAWASKTVWINLIMAIVGVVAVWIPEASQYVTSDVLLTLFGFINIFVRGFTKGAIEFK